MVKIIHPSMTIQVSLAWGQLYTWHEPKMIERQFTIGM
jgi:hypothetical protein